MRTSKPSLAAWWHLKRPADHGYHYGYHYGCYDYGYSYEFMGIIMSIIISHSQLALVFSVIPNWLFVDAVM